MNSPKNKLDSDLHKGVVEDEPPDQPEQSQSSLAGQLGHRSENSLVKNADTDFPEPDGSAEHSGEVE